MVFQNFKSIRKTPFLNRMVILCTISFLFVSILTKSTTTIGWGEVVQFPGHLASYLTPCWCFYRYTWKVLYTVSVAAQFQSYETNVSQTGATIDEDSLEKVCKNMDHRLCFVLREGGSHFEYRLNWRTPTLTGRDRNHWASETNKSFQSYSFQLRLLFLTTPNWAMLMKLSLYRPVIIKNPYVVKQSNNTGSFHAAQVRYKLLLQNKKIERNRIDYRIWIISHWYKSGPKWAQNVSQSESLPVILFEFKYETGSDF